MMQNLISATQALIPVEVIRNGKPFLGESNNIGRTMTASDILDEIGDYVVRLLRMDYPTLAVDDITEEVAQAWIETEDNKPEFPFENVPVYVANSKAWARWNDDAEAMLPVHTPVFRSRPGMPMVEGAKL